MTYTKISARIKQVLKENGQQTQARDIQEEEIRVSINLPYIEGTSEKLQCIFRSQKIRFPFFIESTLHKIIC